jgi:hypothetical protein
MEIDTTIGRGVESDCVARRFLGHFCQGIRTDPQLITTEPRIVKVFSWSSIGLPEWHATCFA